MLPDPTSMRLTAGFRLARLLRDATFRDRLKAAGHHGEPVVPVLADDNFMTLQECHRGSGRCLLAVVDETQPHGWRLFWLQQTPDLQPAEGVSGT